MLTLTLSQGCDNGLGIRAAIGPDGARYFSIEEASRLTGLDKSSGHRRWKAEAVSLVGPDGRQRKYVSADLVEAKRAEVRDRLGLREVDAAPAEGGPTRQAVVHQDLMEAIVRDLLAAEDLGAEALEMERRRGQIYRNVVRQLMPVSDASLKAVQRTEDR